jgi:phosphatidylglycerophosphatase GEP4
MLHNRSTALLTPMQDHFQRLRQAYPGSKLLIVSNTAGTDSDKQQKESALLEANTGVKVLRHSTKKPGCKNEVMAYFKAHPDAGVTRPDQIAIVGDRLSTDIMMANMMGSYGVWVRDGVTGRGFVSAVCGAAFNEHAPHQPVHLLHCGRTNVKPF